ncbi:MAG: hypothetical protein GYB68_06030, partial [Chloroflexi bacterium]|nr:hypothetical protein [Chloroflexota bacterium]
MDLLSTQTDLSLFFHGALSAYRSEDVTYLDRFSPAQFMHFEQDPTWAAFRNCAAGIILAFATDSPTLDISFHSEGARLPLTLGIDVEIDGQLAQGHYFDTYYDPHVRLRLFDLSDQFRRMRRIRVFLPHMRVPRLLSVDLTDNARVEALPRPTAKILSLGDSITQGLDAISPDSIYPNQLGNLFQAEVLNQGEAGHVFDSGSLDPHFPWSPNLITVAYGSNDWASKRLDNPN